MPDYHILVCGKELPGRSKTMAITVNCSESDWYADKHYRLAIEIAKTGGLLPPISCFDEYELSTLKKGIKAVEEKNPENYIILQRRGDDWDYLRPDKVQTMTLLRAHAVIEMICSGDVDHLLDPPLETCSIEDFKAMQVDPSLLAETCSLQEYLDKSKKLS